MPRPQMTDVSKGFVDNLEDALWKIQYADNKIDNNKATADRNHSANEDALCEIDETTSESRTEIEEALCELDEKITALRALIETV